MVCSKCYKNKRHPLPCWYWPSWYWSNQELWIGGNQKAGDIEMEGLFYGQRSNAAYGLINMAQRWRCTYDPVFGKKIYPYALEVVNFWEDYLSLRMEDMLSTVMLFMKDLEMTRIRSSLWLIRNAFDLIIDLSKKHLRWTKTGRKNGRIYY